MFYCRDDAKRCLMEVQIAPRCNLLRVDKIAFGHGVMSSGLSTIRRPHPALKQYKRGVYTMNELMVAFQADDDINLLPQLAAS